MSLTDRGMYLSKAVNQIFIFKLSSVDRMNKDIVGLF